jgi:hypothetical protein
MEPQRSATVNPINALCWQTAHILLQCISSRTRLVSTTCAVTTARLGHHAPPPLTTSSDHRGQRYTLLTDRKVAVWSLGQERTLPTNDPVPGQASGRAGRDGPTHGTLDARTVPRC